MSEVGAENVINNCNRTPLRYYFIRHGQSGIT